MSDRTAGRDLDARLAALPWSRRPRPLRRQLAAALALVVLVSVVLVATLNFFAARDLLLDGTRDQLVGVAEARTRSIEDGASRVLTQAAAASADLTVADSMNQLLDAFAGLAGEELTATQEAELERFYEQEVVAPLVELDVDVTVDDLLPASPEARYLQYHYSLVDPADRAALTDPGDGSTYSELHATVHPYLRELADVLNADDLKLVSDSGEVVYSVQKRIDLGTDLTSGPYADTNLATTLTTTLPRARTGSAVISDIELYLPGGADPTLFATSTVRDDSEELGALVLGVPIESLNAITTADGRWEEVGLESGETYLVGTDSILRSESREWIEDPDAYLDRVDDEVLAERIRTLGSPVGLQPVDTEPVAAALEGDEFADETRNYLGQRTFSHARGIDVAGVDWIVVADIPLDDARAPLLDYIARMAVVLAVLLPLAAALGFFMASRLTRPVGPVLTAAEAIAGGDREPDLPDFGRNEFGDLAERLTDTAHRLGEQEAELEAQYEETRAVLLAALPPRVVDGGTTPSGTGEAIDRATAVAVAVEVGADELQVDETLGRLFATVSRESERLAAANGLERVRAAADRHLFVAGLGVEADGADEALTFATELTRRVEGVGHDEGVDVELRIGVSTGLVETGLLRLGNLSFTAWGEPVRDAMVIGTLAEEAMVGVHDTTAEAATEGRWSLRPASAVHDPEGRVIEVFALATVADPDLEGREPEASDDDRSDSTVG